MGKLVMVERGCIVVVPFAYKEATGGKVRPALALANERNQQVILCMITSTEPPEDDSIVLLPEDLTQGHLPQPLCYIRPQRLFTANTAQNPNIRARLSSAKTDLAVRAVIALLQGKA